MIVRLIISALLFGVCVLAHGAILTTQEKTAVLNRLKQEIHKNYVLTYQIEAIDKTMGELSKSASALQASTHQEMASLLTESLQTVDLHFNVQWSAPDSTKISNDGEGWFAALARKNSGFEKIEILDGNVGYVKFWGFDNVNATSVARLKTVMAMLAGTDAIIFDLRDNGGGSPEMVQLISSYLFKARIHLNSIYWKPSNTTKEYWTLDKVEGIRRPEVPVYVLTSKETFSAAEEFSYNLKQLHRAKIIGESTRGGANPWQQFDLGNGFNAAIPVARAINPITKTNWEHVGVQPDVKVAAKDAFDTAYQFALSTLRKSVKNKHQLIEIDKQLAKLKPILPTLK